MRGRPETGSMMRINCGGRKVRPYCSKRGAKSVMRTDAPWVSVSMVETSAVLRTYSDCADTSPSSRTSVKPFSSSPASRRQNTGSLSKRGKHHHTIRAIRLTSAAVRPLPITATSRFCCAAVMSMLGWTFIKPPFRSEPSRRSSAARRSARRTCRRCPAPRVRPRRQPRRIPASRRTPPRRSRHRR